MSFLATVSEGIMISSFSIVPNTDGKLNQKPYFKAKQELIIWAQVSIPTEAIALH